MQNNYYKLKLFEYFKKKRKKNEKKTFSYKKNVYIKTKPMP